MNEEIAVIGMVGRFPGADSVEALWDVLKEGRETIGRFAPTGDPAYVGARGTLSDAFAFDAAFWGISPNEALVTDPQQRVFLECAYQALEAAGVDPKRFTGAVGVFAGMSNNTYFSHAVKSHPELIEAVGDLNAMMGNEKDYLATRVAYKLSLSGPAINVYTACSTSMVAVCQAVQSLLSYQCDVALAGGISLILPQESGYTYHEGGIRSPDGRCRSYDEKASGTVFSNGVGVVALKRLSEALADGDTIHAVIKGAALNNDGDDKVSFTAPSVEGQAGAIALAQALAGVEPQSIGYVEGHGTATNLGDPIEVAGLTRAFREGTEEVGFCALGSLKSNIGHLDAAAGIAGLIKTVLVLKHAQIPPVVHFTTPNPKLNLETSPFFVPTTLIPWHSEGPRRAGVSSFGVGGTNAHVVLEEAPTAPESGPSRAIQLLTLSARSEAAMERQSALLADHLDSPPEQPLADIAYTLATGRMTHPHRLTLVASSPADAASVLRTAERRRLHTARAETRTVTFLFPGQGVQAVNMGRGLYESEPAFAFALDACAHILKSPLGLDLRTVLYPAPGGESAAHSQLTETWLTQPALFSVEYALAQLWESLGIRPDAMLGHSVGEYVAACLAGVFSLEDGLTLLAERARLMASVPAGAMLAVRLPEAELLPLLSPSVSIASINAPGSCVASGPTEEIEVLERVLSERKLVHKRLSTSHAFHSAMMDSILPEFEKKLRAVALHEPKLPYISSLTGEWITPEQATDPSYWCRQLREAVRFADGVATLLTDPAQAILEVGPGQTLSALVRQHPARREQPVIASLPAASSDRPEPDAVLEALGQLWACGATDDLAPLFVGETRRKLPLPLYPFEKTVFQLEPTPTMNPEEPTITIHLPAAAAVPAPSPASDSRLPRLRAELCTLFARLSGLSESKIAPDAPFTDLGFDSLFLTQASQSIGKKYGLKLTLRQLLDDLGSVDSLAVHLDAALPADPAPEGAPVSPASIPESVPIQSATPARAEAGSGTLVERVVSQQLALMAEQLRLLGSGAPVPAMVAPPTPSPTPTPTPTAQATPIRAFGPYRPLDKNAGELNKRQKNAIASLVRRYEEKMPGSKRVTQEGRKFLADPRAVAGFKATWKEMVFPVVTEKSEGARLWDIDGNEYIDLTLGFGTNFLGHRPPFVVEALERQLALGMEIGPQSPLAARVAEKLCRITGMERAAFCNTGSEAVTAAIRVARTVTGRDKIALFSGAYHGQFDEVLVRAAGESSLPVAPGIPDSAVENVLVLEYGTDESLEILRREAGSLAAVLVEPVQSRQPDLQPVEFVRELRKITQESGCALVFDEVVTGFRTHPGGVQALWDVRADIATYGKVVGGGFPIGIVTGTARFLDALDGGFWSFGDDSAPEAGMTFFAGTFVRHPLALAAADAVLDHLLANPNLQSDLSARTAAFVESLNAAFLAMGVPIRLNSFSSMFYVQIPPELKLAGLLYYALRLRGVHLWEGRPGFLSTVHTDDDIEQVKAAFLESTKELLDGELLPSFSAPKPRPTEAQREVWLAARLSDGASCALNESLSLELNGPLDSNRLQAALNGLVARHEALRTTFSPEDGTPVLHPTGALVLQRASGDVRELADREGQLPFDLENGPLVRATVVTESPEHHTLILSAHHLVCDGWSFGVLLSELKALYEGETLPPAPSFAEYAASNETDEETLSRWFDRLETLPSPLQLPQDRPHPPTRSWQGGRVSLPLPASTLEGLRTLGREQGATLFATLLAGLSGLLHRLTGQQDMILGAPAAGQATEGVPGLVGHCVHLLPLRLSAAPESSFTTHLAGVKEAVLDAFEHPNVTLGTLVSRLEAPRERGRIPLTGVTFNLDKETLPTSLGEAKVRVEKNLRSFFQFDLGFNLVETESGLTLEANYNADILDVATVRRWLEYYATLLAAIVENPSVPLERLPLIDSADEAEILGWSRGRKPDYPKKESIPGVFAAHAMLTPDAVAVRTDGESLTYSQLEERSRALACRLVARGVRQGDRVGVVLERTPTLIVALLAVLRAGASYVPLDTAHPAERRAALLKDASVALTLDEATLEALEGGSDEELRASLPTVTGDDAAYVMYTSGSTGLPKGVVVPHRAILRLVLETDYVQLTPADVLGQAATVAFDAATFEIWGALLNGASMALLSKEALLCPAGLRESLAHFGVTTLFLTTALFNEIARQAPDAFSGLTWLLFGGEVSDAECARRVLRSGPPKNLVHVYGPTEATTFATFWPVREIAEDATTLPIGRPISHTDAFVLNESGQLCACGVSGELYLGGDGLAHGYLDDDARSADRFVELAGRGRLYKTGDRVRWSKDGQLEFLGRGDGQIKLRGFRIEPGEIEATLRSHPSVEDACVVLRDERLVAYFIPAIAPGAATGCQELRNFLAARLPSYMVPVAYVSLPSLPLNANGKRDVSALPAPDDSCLAVDGASEAPSTAMERTLARLWSELLGRPVVGIHDDFFALGGHSLLVVRLLSRIETELGKRLPLASLFAAPTIALQAQMLADGAPVPTSAQTRSLVALHPHGERPRLYCVHHGYGDLTGYHELVRCLGDDQPVYGFQAKGIDGEAEPLERIEEMAAHYIAELRAFQPDGPYHLTGFSLGGVIAFEMARQLRESGADVGLLALLDTYAPIFFQRGERGGLLSELVGVAGDMFRVAPQDRWRFAVTKGRAATHRLRSLLHRAESSGKDPEESRLRDALLKVEMASRRALESYTPSQYAGRAVVFRAKDGEVTSGFDPVLWWSEVVPGGIEVCELPGDHHAILKAPGVAQLAHRLRQCLDEATARP